jgi:hypothetical protein
MPRMKVQVRNAPYIGGWKGNHCDPNSFQWPICDRRLNVSVKSLWCFIDLGLAAGHKSGARGGSRRKSEGKKRTKKRKAYKGQPTVCPLTSTVTYCMQVGAVACRQAPHVSRKRNPREIVYWTETRCGFAGHCSADDQSRRPHGALWDRERLDTSYCFRHGAQGTCANNLAIQVHGRHR